MDSFIIIFIIDLFVFSADKHQGDAGHRHGVRGTHRSSRDAIQQHQNVIR